MTRRIAAGILAAAIAGALGPAAGAVPVPVPNGDFEAGLEGWMLHKPEGFAHGEAAIETADVHGGGRAAHLRNEPAGERVLIGLANSAAIPLPDSCRTFGITVWMKARKMPEMVELRIASADRSGKPLGPWQEKGWRFIRPALPPHDGRWAPFQAEFVAQDDWGGVFLTVWVRGAGADVLVDDVSLETQLPQDWEIASCGARLPDPAPGVAMWWEGPLRKVYPDETPPAAAGTGLELDAAGGECQPVQLCLRSGQPLSRVRAVCGDLRGPAVLPGSVLDARLVGLVDVRRPTSGHGRTGPTPDPLLPEEAFDLPAGETRSLWLTLRVPPETPGGDYAGALNVSGEGFSAEVPLRVRVYGFTLPARPTLRTIARIWQRHEGYEDLFLKNLREHRCSGTSYIGGITVQVRDGAVVVDSSGLHEAVQQRLRAYDFTVFNVPSVFLGDASGPYSKDGKWNGFDLFSPEFDAAFESYCRQVAGALQGEGVLPFALWQVWDEPHDQWVPKAAHLARLVKKAAPEARVYMTAGVDERLADTVDIWCLPWPSTFTPAAEAARARGATLWAYENGLYSLDVGDSSLAMRHFLWRLRRYDVRGVEWWAVSQWKSDPWTTPNQYPPQNGGGFFLYPTPDRKGAPIDSIRWEMYREGVEDYDILSLLAETQDRVLAGRGLTDPRLKGRAQAEELAARVALDMARTVQAPLAADTARREACRRLELLQGESPVLLGISRGPDGRSVVIVPGDAAVRLDGQPRTGALIEHVSPAGAPLVVEVARGPRQYRLSIP